MGGWARLTLEACIAGLVTHPAFSRPVRQNDEHPAAVPRVVDWIRRVVIGGNGRYRVVCPSCFYSDAEDLQRAPGLFG